ncbi:sensor histidine kinase [Saccharopolyspora sp. MS10]|uniref:sensor histidine kinase n=1 Tax=Saccharopolyspora sp. MS10 TaxID=3385973 RepID=UPI00399F6E07
MLRGPRSFARTLRGRLVLLLIGAAVAGLVAMGFASQLLLRNSLLDKLDGRLHEMSRPWLDVRPPPPPGPRDGDEQGPRLPTDFRALLFAPGGALEQVHGPTESDPRQPMIDRPGPDGEIITVPDRSGGADWRVLTETRPDGARVSLALSTGDVDQTLRWLLVIELVVGGIVVAVLAAVAMVTVRLGLRPLTRIEHTAHAIATGELDRRVADQDPGTETGRLGAALNAMLGRLVAALQQREQSELRLRRFVADASHELRTPLTSIRGFAELYRRSDSPGEQDVRRMMSRIEGEAVRMGDLVEDLLLLARLDRERTIDLVDLDLVPLARDVAGDARVRDAGRRIDVVVPEGAVRVLGDGPRLRQALTNLMTNALVHTPPGSPVRISVAHGAAREDVFAAGADPGPGTAMGVVSVRDSGPGIAPEHARRIFDRFYRVDDGRERSEGGSGLGLAITAAIAEAHHGRVELSTGPAGSTFRLLVPLS